MVHKKVFSGNIRTKACVGKFKIFCETKCFHCLCNDISTWCISQSIKEDIWDAGLGQGRVDFDFLESVVLDVFIRRITKPLPSFSHRSFIESESACTYHWYVKSTFGHLFYYLILYMCNIKIKMKKIHVHSYFKKVSNFS